MTKAEILAWLASTRDDHQGWADYMRAHPDYDPGDMGDAAFHDACVAEYNEIIQSLERIFDD